MLSTSMLSVFVFNSLIMLDLLIFMNYIVSVFNSLSCLALTVFVFLVLIIASRVLFNNKMNN